MKCGWQHSRSGMFPGTVYFPRLASALENLAGTRITSFRMRAWSLIWLLAVPYILHIHTYVVCCTTVLELESKHSFIWLPSAVLWPLSLPGCRTEIRSQQTGVSQGSAHLLRASYWALLTGQVTTYGTAATKRDRSTRLRLMGPLPFICPDVFNCSASCGQSMMSASSLLRWHLRRFPNIAIYPKIIPNCTYSHFPPNS